MSNKEKISNIQLTFLMMGYVFGSSSIISSSAAAKQDAWLAFLMGLLGGLALIGVYIAIYLLNPGKNLIEILEQVFGQILGSIIGLLYIWYFIHLGALVIRNFADFMVPSFYSSTPRIILSLVFIITVIFIVKKGIEIVARISDLFLPIVLFGIVATFFLLVTKYDIQNLFPFLEFGIKPVIKASFSVLTFPFGETVIFLMIFPLVNDKSRLTKSSYTAIIIIGLFLFGITVRDLLVLGPDMFTRTVFPPTISTKLIPLGNFDVLIAVNLLIGGVVKISVCLYGAVKGITHVFKIDDYRWFVLTTGLIMLSLSIWVYDNTPEMLLWASEIYPFYVVPFQIIFPSIILISSLLKNRGNSVKGDENY